MKKGCSVLWLVALLAGCGDDGGADHEPLVRSVRYTVAEPGGVGSVRTFGGVVRAATESALSFQVSGRVTELAVDVGDSVAEGDLIARVDPTDFEIQMAEARAAAAQAGAQARGAAATYDRIRALYENNNASRQDLDNARSQRDASRAAASAAQQSVRRLQRQVEHAELTAPAAGTIRSVAVEVDEVVSPGRTVAVLQAGERLIVAVDVPEAFINRVERGDPASIAVEAAGATDVTGTVFEVGAPDRGGAVFPVTVRLPDDAGELRPGMASEVTFDLSEGGADEDPAIRLPLSAVSEDGSGRFAYVVERTEEGFGTVHRRGVEVGAIEASGIAIEEGLEAGELVVTAGVSRIYDGLRVRVPAEPGDLR